MGKRRQKHRRVKYRRPLVPVELPPIRRYLKEWFDGTQNVEVRI